MDNLRIRAIHDAALSLFLNQGYAQTQISQIAKAVGVSVGTIYHDFAGKEEIKQFILKCALNPGYINCEFTKPITGDLFANLETEIIAALENSQKDFGQNLPQAGINYSFESLISDAFDLLSNHGAGCLFIEKNPLECGFLFNCYQNYRKQFFANMGAYIEAFISKGILRQLKDPQLSTALIIEILVWWAMDRRYIAFEKLDITLEQAKEVCLDNIITAYKL